MTTPKTQQKSTIPLSDQTRTATGCSQWLLESDEDVETPIFHFNTLDVLICGQVSFAKIAEDIKLARKSIDIIAYGFDPAMELVRGNDGTWPRGGNTPADTSTTYGALLRAAAQRGVKVRLLVWYSPLLVNFAHNVPGYKTVGKYERQSPVVDPAVRARIEAQTRSTPAHPILAPRAPPTDLDKREMFNSAWWRDTVAGKIPGLSMRTRGGHHDDVVASLKTEIARGASANTRMETITLEFAATHHQKTIVIDYDDEGADAKPLAYVMGLNSLTDYWDRSAHAFNDPLRGQNDEGDGSDHSVGKDWEYASSGQATLKPYQDFVSRIEGDAVAAVFKNFVEGWNSARKEDACAGSNDSSTVDLKKVPKRLTQRIRGPYQRVQIVRTQPSAPGGGEHAIERTYYQASSFARHYVYIENQYFQNTDWVRNLKAVRKKFVQDLGAAGMPQTEIPTLHVIAVTPTPERWQMVPRTHDVVTELGQGDSMPDQDKQVEQEIKDYEVVQRARQRQSDPLLIPPPKPLSEIAKSHKAASSGQDAQAVRKELTNTLGMRTLVCSLWTYDKEWSLDKTKVGQQASKEKRDYKEAQEQWDRQQAERTQARSSDHQAGGWGLPADNGGIGRPAMPPDRSEDLEKATAQRYREIYIHSKLMIIDDSFFTLGSANLNLRSFAVDSEINMATDNRAKATELRRQVWGQHTSQLKDLDGGANAVDQRALKGTFKGWEDEAAANFDRKKNGDPLSCALVKFYDERKSSIRWG